LGPTVVTEKNLESEKSFRKRRTLRRGSIRKKRKQTKSNVGD